MADAPAPVTAAVLAERLAAGAISAREVVDACLARIAEREPTMRAFAHVDPDHARAMADALDRHRKAGRPLGALHGLPVGVKDVIDTRDYPTENGTAQDVGRRPREDATLVARLRAAGAVVIGKTATTELAFQTPAATMNPHNADRTPGGSSSGSAVAVADGMVPLAIGTQTGGSVIRPASFCGVVGYKPSHGAISMTGVLAHSEHLDTAGVFAATLADAALLAGALMGHDPRDPRTRVEPVPDLPAAARAQPPVTPRFAVVRGPTWEHASEDMGGLLAEVREALEDGADDVDLPEVFLNAPPSHRRLMTVGFARNLARYVDGGAVGAAMREGVEEGRATSAVDYLAAVDWRTALIAGIERVFDRYDAILTAAAPGEAPGRETTGSAAFNALWTMLGTPAITLPMGTGSTGLPLGLQVVGRPREDARLVRTAAWLERRLGGR
ncbi:amidase [Acuticoccus sp.]|uniref:amidase n=1 Tax=Acuticoccus sp. TaxID=1904378 RepID=UPI003B51BB14